MSNDIIWISEYYMNKKADHAITDDDIEVNMATKGEDLETP